jgi:hypothetical protein
VFQIKRTTRAETVVYSFGSSGADSAEPNGLLDVEGALYGTTQAGGNGGCQQNNITVGCGTVYKLTLP